MLLIHEVAVQDMKLPRKEQVYLAKASCDFAIGSWTVTQRSTSDAIPELSNLSGWILKLRWFSTRSRCRAYGGHMIHAVHDFCCLQVRITRDPRVSKDATKGTAEHIPHSRYF